MAGDYILLLAISPREPVGALTRYEYDTAGRRTKTIKVNAGGPADSAWTNTYNDARQLATSKDPLDKVTTYNYDGAGRLVVRIASIPWVAP